MGRIARGGGKEKPKIEGKAEEGRGEGRAKESAVESAEEGSKKDSKRRGEPETRRAEESRDESNSRRRDEESQVKPAGCIQEHCPLRAERGHSPPTLPKRRRETMRRQPIAAYSSGCSRMV